MCFTLVALAPLGPRPCRAIPAVSYILVCVRWWAVGYTENPEKLQLIIRTLYEYISKKGYNIEGVDVTTLPLFKILDGNNTNDYIQRVEPSITGGKKIATSFTDIVFS